MKDILLRGFISTLPTNDKVEREYNNCLKSFSAKVNSIKELVHGLYEGAIIPEETFRRIGKGSFSIYDLNNGMVLKVNSTKTNFKAGEKLKDLQGLPFVPNIHYFSTDGKYIIMDKVNGVPIHYYQKASWFAVKNFSVKKHNEKVKDFINGSISKGWFPNGLSSFDCMVVEDGTFWFTDVDYFVEYKGQKTESAIKTLESYGESIVDSYDWNRRLVENCGREYLYKLNYLRNY